MKLRPPVRRRIAAFAGIGWLVLALVAPTTTSAAGVKLTQVVSGLQSPVGVVSADDGSGRLFVIEQAGRIRIVKGTTLVAKPFLNIADKVGSGGERGLLGLAFHPNYASNGRFYVNFTRARDGATVINEYRVSSDPDVAIKASHRRILTIKQPAANHNGGQLVFGPDHRLYIGTGDGGGVGDPGNRAQRLDSLLGKILRINVNKSSGAGNYKSPRSNPYVGRPGRNEIWSRGLRNPWRFSFDRVTGDLWIGDVGQYAWEEIDRSRTSAAKSRGRGVNFGWRVMEGNHCYQPSSGCNRSGKAKPVAEYSHTFGCSVIGGYAYRGSDVPALAGRYLFGDFCSGRIWTVSRTASRPATRSLLLDTSLNITSFGEDEAGELYLVETSGRLYRVDPA